MPPNISVDIAALIPLQLVCPITIILFTLSISTAYCITELQLKSVCETIFPIFLWINISPGSVLNNLLGSARESEQPINKNFGVCFTNKFSN